MLGATLTAADYLERLEDELQKIDLAAVQRWSDLLYQA